MAQITGSDELVTKGELKDFYDAILPYLGGMPEALANKFEKSNLYSTTEKIIGCWTDGRPIYQKVFTGTVPQCVTIGTGVTGYVSIGSSVSNFVNVRCIGISSSSKNQMFGTAIFTKQDGVVDGSTGNINYRGIRIYACPNNSTTTENRNKIAIVNTDTSLNVYSYVLIAQYTKTTDAANSFKYGNETDYSTDEKIVGTWTDGKPIYQKTYLLSSDVSVNFDRQWHTIIENVYDIDELIDCKLSRKFATPSGLGFTTQTMSLNNIGYSQTDHAIKGWDCSSSSDYITFNRVTIQYTKTTD